MHDPRELTTSPVDDETARRIATGQPMIGEIPEPRVVDTTISSPDEFRRKHLPVAPEGDDDAALIGQQAEIEAARMRTNSARIALAKKPLDVTRFVDPEGYAKSERRREIDELLAAHTGPSRDSVPPELTDLLDRLGNGKPYQHGGVDGHVDEGPNGDEPETTGGAVKPTRAQIRASRRRGKGKPGAPRQRKWCPAHETYHLVPVTK